MPYADFSHLSAIIIFIGRGMFSSKETIDFLIAYTKIMGCIVSASMVVKISKKQWPFIEEDFVWKSLKVSVFAFLFCEFITMVRDRLWFLHCWAKMSYINMIIWAFAGLFILPQVLRFIIRCMMMCIWWFYSDERRRFRTWWEQRSGCRRFEIKEEPFDDATSDISSDAFEAPSLSRLGRLRFLFFRC